MVTSLNLKLSRKQDEYLKILKIFLKILKDLKRNGYSATQSIPLIYSMNGKSSIPFLKR
jgi:hypothetical protein